MLGTAVYLVSPFDIAPDFLPVVGQIDDVMLAGLLFTELSQMLMAKLQDRKDNKDVTNVTTGTTNASTGNPANQTVDIDAETVITN